MGRDLKLDAKGNSVIAVAEPQFLSLFHATIQGTSRREVHPVQLPE
jgi:hypothetical protein